VLVTVFFLACACVFGTGVRLWWTFLVDDAFITFRYADNLAGGHGIVWNIGEEHTEGYSSPLHLALLAPVALAGVSLLGFMKAFGILAIGAGVPALLAQAARTLDWKGESGALTAALLVPGVWLLPHSNIVHAISGMETSLVLLTYTGFALAVHSFSGTESTDRRRRPLAFATTALAIAVMLARPEGGAVATLGLGALCFDRRTRRAALGMLGAIFAFLAAYLAWKWHYFGYLLPNPYYHKVAPAGWGPFPGQWEVRAFLLQHIAFALLPPLALVANPPSRRAPLHAVELMSWGVVLFHLTFFLRVAHIMGYDHRFCWPSMPFFMLLAIFSIQRVAVRERAAEAEAVGQGALRRVTTGAARGLGAAMLFAGACLQFAQRSTLGMLLHPTGKPPVVFDAKGAAYLSHWRIGSVLGALDLDYKATTVSAMEAGIIPYLSRTRSFDVVGLNDNIITRGTPQEKQKRREANPLDVFYTVSTTGAIDDLAIAPAQLQGDPDGSRSRSRNTFEANARNCYYAGHYRWGADPVRQDFVMWVRRSHPRSREIARALLESADRVEAASLRWGPYDVGLLDSIKIPDFDEVVRHRKPE